MCYVVHVGTPTARRPVVPSDGPALRVEALDAERAARAGLHHPYVYDVGAHTGCACGFVRPEVDDDDDGQWEASMSLLVAWLVEAAADGPVEVLVCWAGEEGAAALRTTTAADDFATLDLRAAWDRPMRIVVEPPVRPR